MIPWIFNNREATFYFSTGKLGGIQGGGPNVIGIISAISAIYFFYFTLQNYISSGSIFSHKGYPFYFLISSINLFFTFSRGSYLAFIYGFLILIAFERFFKLKVKIFVYFGILIFGTISLFLFILLKIVSAAFSGVVIKNSGDFSVKLLVEI